VEFAYRPELWQSLFDMAALAAVTLAGLIFVGLSINLRNVVSSPVHLARAREALVALTVLLTVAIFVLIPEQGRVPVGIELLALSALVWIVSLRLQWNTVHRLAKRQRRSWVMRLIGLDSATLCITLAGAGLVTGRMGGLLWLVPTILICLIWSTYNAWSLMIDAMDAERKPPV
jgi:modulator of FtsH protease